MSNMQSPDKTSDSLDVFCKSMSFKKGTKRMSKDLTIEYFTSLRQLEQELSENFCEKKVLKRKTLIDKIVSSCLPYVLSLAKKHSFNNDKEVLKELVSAGNLGLCKAVVKFKHDKNVPFHNFATWWIRAEFFEYLSNRNKIVKSSKSKKGKDNPNTTIYYQGHGDEDYTGIGQEVETVEELLDEPYDGDYDAEQVETIMQVNDVISRMHSLQQFIFSAKNEIWAEKGIYFTAMKDLLGIEVSSLIIKDNFQDALNFFQSSFEEID